jgi:MFS family permease
MSTNSLNANNSQVSHSNCTPSSAGRAASALTWWAAASFASIVGFSRISYGLLLPSIRMDLPGNYGSYGLIGTVNFVGYLLGTLVVPLLLASHRDRIKLNSGALVVMNVALLLSATSLNLLQLGIWRFLIGFCSAPALVLTLALTLERTAPGERGRALGIVWMGASLGIIFSGLIAPLLISTGLLLAWRLAWSVMGIGGVATVLGFHRTLRAYDARRPSSGVQASDAQPTQPEANPIALLVELLQLRGFLFATLSYLAMALATSST